MRDPAHLIATTDKAWAIFTQLQDRDLPVISAFGCENGRKIGVAFQLSDAQAGYVVRCPVDEANADWFERMYRVVA